MIKDAGRIAGPEVLRTSTALRRCTAYGLDSKGSGIITVYYLGAARLTFPFAVGEGVFEVKALTRDITFPTYFRCCARPCLDDCQWNITYCVPARPIVAKSEWYNDFNRERH